MDVDEDLPLERIELPGGVWRLVPRKPYHSKTMEQGGYDPRRTSCPMAYEVIPQGMNPDIDLEIEQIQRQAADYRRVKKEKVLSEKPLDTKDVTSIYRPCLAIPSVSRVGDQPTVFPQPSGICQIPEPEEIPDLSDWRKRKSRNPTAVRILLANDYESRKMVRWNLIPYEEFCQFVYPSLGNVPVTVPLPYLKSVAKEEELYVIEAKPISDEEYKIPDTRETPIKQLYKNFPFLTELFGRHRGSIAVAGGAITRLFARGSRSPTGSGTALDVDIFFYGLIGNQPTEKEIKRAEDRAALILKDCVAALCTLSPLYFRVENKEYVTNVYVRHPTKEPHGWRTGGYDYHEKCYQFIKRIYPTKDSIIGGFDLGPSMLLYDGDNIYGTEMGAWSIAKRTLVVDTTRRSLTFERRIFKYWSMGFNIVFPGIRAVTMEAYLRDPDFDEDAAVDAIGDLFRSLGIRPRYEGRGEEGYDYAIRNLLRGDDFIRELPPVKISDLRILPKRNIFYAGAKTLRDKPFDPNHWVAKSSDYNDQFLAEHRIDAAASSSLRCNNLDAVFTYFFRDLSDEIDYDQETTPNQQFGAISYTEAYVAFENLINCPMVITDPFYRERVHWLLTAHRIESLKSRQWINYFAEFGPRVREIMTQVAWKLDDPFISRVITLLDERMKVNAIKCEERLKGLKWITQEPGRQWTSSIKPIRESPVDFYGVKFYTPFRLGMPEPVETALRIIWRRGQPNGSESNSLGMLPRDLFKLLLKFIWKSYVYNAMAIKTPAITIQLPGTSGNPGQYHQFPQLPNSYYGFQIPQQFQPQVQQPIGLMAQPVMGPLGTALIQRDQPMQFPVHQITAPPIQPLVAGPFQYPQLPVPPVAGQPIQPVVQIAQAMPGPVPPQTMNEIFAKLLAKVQANQAEKK